MITSVASLPAPAVPAGSAELSIPDLLDVAAPRVAGLPSCSYLTLHGLFRSVAAEVLDLDLDTREGRSRAVVAADAMCRAVAEHLLFHGQHPHPDFRTTLADWMLSARRAVVRAELGDAAQWWRSLQQPGRLL
jgi:hypothetical protein